MMNTYQYGILGRQSVDRVYHAVDYAHLGTQITCATQSAAKYSIDCDIQSLLPTAYLHRSVILGRADTYMYIAGYMEKRHTVRILCLMLGRTLTRRTKFDEMRWKLRWRHARDFRDTWCTVIMMYSTSFSLDVPFQHKCQSSAVSRYSGISRPGTCHLARI